MYFLASVDLDVAMTASSDVGEENIRSTRQVPVHAGEQLHHVDDRPMPRSKPASQGLEGS